MGNFYVNVTLKGPDRGDVAGFLRAEGYRAYVSPTADGVTTVVEERCDTQDLAHITAFAADLSGKLACPAFAVLNHDDDVLAYWLFDNGDLDHRYNSNPAFFAEMAGRTVSEADLRPAGGDARALCDALGRPGYAKAVRLVLRRTNDEIDHPWFAYERHAALLKALGIPQHAVGLGWTYLQHDEYPPGMSASDFVEL